MDKKRVFLIALGLLWTVVAGLLAAAALRIYSEGMVLRASGDALAWIYTREKAAAAFAPIAPVFFVAAGLTVLGLILGWKDGKAQLPVKDVRIVRKGKRGPGAAACTPRSESRHARIVRAVLLASAAVMILVGILNDGLRDVLIKAINLCMECVGLG